MKELIKKAINLFGAGTDEKMFGLFMRLTQPYQRYRAKKAYADEVSRIVFADDTLRTPEEYKILADIKQLMLTNSPVATTSFPYAWADFAYRNAKVKVLQDSNCGMKYVLFDGKKLYFPGEERSKDIIDYYISTQIIEQHEQSAHRYTSGSFSVSQGDIVADVGACEGNFSLANIEQAKKIYMFEPQHKWAQCLRQTFAPWREKVEIIEKFVSDENTDTSITLDAFFKDKEPPDFLKVDIEGFEEKMLSGATEILGDSRPIKIALCVYHREGDDEKYMQSLRDYGFDLNFVDGRMIFYDMTQKTLRFSKGVIRAARK